MGKFIHLILIVTVIGLLSCGMNQKIVDKGGENSISLSDPVEDSLEYELLIIDVGFESWFIKNRKPIWYHELSYLENWNQRYVVAWNIKAINSRFQLMYPDNPFIESISYQPFAKYGKEINHKLFYYFKYIEATWGKLL